MTTNAWPKHNPDKPLDDTKHSPPISRGEPTVINYLAVKVLPIAIPWLGVALALLGLQNLDKQKWPALNVQFVNLIEWPVLLVTTACAILGIVLYLSLLGLFARSGEKYRSWFKEDAAQEVISVVLNMAVAAVYSKMFSDTWTYFAIGVALIALCYGSWRTFCFND